MSTNVWTSPPPLEYPPHASPQSRSHEPNTTPIRTLFDGPIDIVGDVHGEYEALCQLMAGLGYDRSGQHLDGRRLVFVGDLVDRGPHNVSVVNLVRGLVEAGRAQCILGNHELNLLRRQAKDGNGWFRGEHADDGHHAFDEVLTSDDDRQDVLEFLGGLPLALEREDLRVVHACWDQRSIDVLRRQAKVLDLFHEYEHVLGEQMKTSAVADKLERQLTFQNRNPVKVLTSGFESRHPAGFMHNGKMRFNQRVAWWKDYAGEQPFCVFGHYSRVKIPGNDAYIFDDDDVPHEPLGAARNCTCIDLGGGWRPAERRSGVTSGYTSRFVALRWPERVLVEV